MTEELKATAFRDWTGDTPFIDLSKFAEEIEKQISSQVQEAFQEGCATGLTELKREIYFDPTPFRGEIGEFQFLAWLEEPYEFRLVYDFGKELKDDLRGLEGSREFIHQWADYLLKLSKEVRAIGDHPDQEPIEY